MLEWLLGLMVLMQVLMVLVQGPNLLVVEGLLKRVGLQEQMPQSMLALELQLEPRMEPWLEHIALELLVEAEEGWQKLQL